jgi:hypothetical protein
MQLNSDAVVFKHTEVIGIITEGWTFSSLAMATYPIGVSIGLNLLPNVQLVNNYLYFIDANDDSIEHPHQEKYYWV